MALAGVLLKSTQSTLRLIQLLGSILILGIFSYFLAVQAHHHLYKPTWVKAVEGIAGASVLWSLFALLLTCFVGGKPVFGTLAMLLDLLFLGGFIAVTILTRGGRRSCSGYISTPLGSGNTRTGVTTTRPANSRYSPHLKRTCRLEKAVFAVAIILFTLFLVSALVQFLLVRHHKKEKRYGPSPANNYTAGSGRRGFFGRKKVNTHDAELATAGTTATTTGVLETEKKHNHMGSSHEDGYTGSTVAQTADPGYGHKGSTVAQPAHHGYDEAQTVHGGTVPVGTAAYGTGTYSHATGPSQVRY